MYQMKTCNQRVFSKGTQPDYRVKNNDSLWVTSAQGFQFPVPLQLHSDVHL